jgi:hypothetical protein
MRQGPRVPLVIPVADIAQHLIAILCFFVMGAIPFRVGQSQ